MLSFCIYVLIKIPAIWIFFKKNAIDGIWTGYTVLSNGVRKLHDLCSTGFPHPLAEYNKRKGELNETGKVCVGKIGDKSILHQVTSLRFCDNRNKIKCSPRWADNMSPTRRAFSSSSMFPEQQFAPFRHNLERHRMNASFFKSVT